MWRQGICRGALLVTIAPTIALAGALSLGSRPVEPTAPAAESPPRVHCATPRTLRLRRFEDRSAQLLCGRRVIVRVSAPG